MKLLRPRTFIIFAMVGLSGTVLLHTSQNVQHAEEQLEALELSIYREEEKIRMLRAEWETLNRPERLEQLADEFLDLVPPSPNQMAGGQTALPDPVAEEIQIEENFEPVLQPVAYEAPEAARGFAPVPASKPKRTAIKSPSAPAKRKDKGFDDLLGELGGSQ